MVCCSGTTRQSSNPFWRKSIKPSRSAPVGRARRVDRAGLGAGQKRSHGYSEYFFVAYFNGACKAGEALPDPALESLFSRPLPNGCAKCRRNQSAPVLMKSALTSTLYWSSKKALDLTHCHSGRIHRDDLLIEAFKALLPFSD
jgi:hypothetical protein